GRLSGWCPALAGIRLDGLPGVTLSLASLLSGPSGVAITRVPGAARAPGGAVPACAAPVAAVGLALDLAPALPRTAVPVVPATVSLPTAGGSAGRGAAPVAPVAALAGVLGLARVAVAGVLAAPFRRRGRRGELG